MYTNSSGAVYPCSKPTHKRASVPAKVLYLPTQVGCGETARAVSSLRGRLRRLVVDGRRLILLVSCTSYESQCTLSADALSLARNQSLSLVAGLLLTYGRRPSCGQAWGWFRLMAGAEEHCVA